MVVTVVDSVAEVLQEDEEHQEAEAHLEQEEGAAQSQA